MRPIPARIETRCLLCDEMIHEGDDIVNMDDQWVHHECAIEDGYNE